VAAFLEVGGHQTVEHVGVGQAALGGPAGGFQVFAEQVLDLAREAGVALAGVVDDGVDAVVHGDVFAHRLFELALQAVEFTQALEVVIQQVVEATAVFGEFGVGGVAGHHQLQGGFQESPLGLALALAEPDGLRSCFLRGQPSKVNTYRTVSPIAPFGGVNQSGYGREAGVEAVLDYTRTKTVWVDASGGGMANPFVMR